MSDMGSTSNMLRIKIFLSVALFFCACSSVTASVSYDDRAIVINGHRRILISGSIHYPRSTPEPKWGHLKDLHKAIKLCEPALVSAYPKVTQPGNNLEVHEFRSKSACAAFLANYNTRSPAKVTFQNMQYDVPPWSISILPDCKNAVFNTARISSQTSQMKMTPVGSGAFSWQSYNEETVSADDSDTMTMQGLRDQIYITRDASDYLWYLTE
ncbi:hypothetical protein U1Q18_028719 [Sarracenia purpurea var. burkii]